MIGSLDRHAIGTHGSITDTDFRTTLGTIELMTVFHIANHHMVIQNVVQTVQNGIFLQFHAILVGQHTDRVAHLARFRVIGVNTGIDAVLIRLAGIVVETQHLLLRTTVGDGVDIVLQGIVRRQEEAVT